MTADPNHRATAHYSLAHHGSRQGVRIGTHIRFAVSTDAVDKPFRDVLLVELRVFPAVAVTDRYADAEEENELEHVGNELLGVLAHPQSYLRRRAIN